MHSRVNGLALAFMTVLIILGGLLSQTAAPQGKANAPAPDLTGVWRRSRRPPDNTRRYTLGELTGSLGNEMSPLTPWGEAKFKAAKPNGGPHGVSLAETNDPIYKCFPRGCREFILPGWGGRSKLCRLPDG